MADAVFSMAVVPVSYKDLFGCLGPSRGIAMFANLPSSNGRALKGHGKSTLLHRSGTDLHGPGDVLQTCSMQLALSTI